MKFFATIASVMLLSSLTAPSVLAAGLPDTPENRTAEAKRYLTITPMSTLMREMTDEMAKTLPAEHKALFVKYMNEFVRIDVLEKASVDAMVKHLTAGEIKALADFYASPEGRSVMAKMPAYMNEITPVMMQEMSRAATAMQEQMVKQAQQKK